MLRLRRSSGSKGLRQDDVCGGTGKFDRVAAGGGVEDGHFDHQIAVDVVDAEVGDSVGNADLLAKGDDPGEESVVAGGQAEIAGKAANSSLNGGAIEAEPTVDVLHVSRAVVYMASLPLSVNVQFMTVMATKMPFVGRG